MNNFSRREFIETSSLILAGAFIPDRLGNGYFNKFSKRIGIIGLDISHSVAFTKTLHQDKQRFKGYSVIAAYPYGTKTIPSATSRIPRYTDDMKSLGVEIVDSIEELLRKVDFVFLETNDGRLHLEQARQVFEAKKPLFIDKPIAASYRDAFEIFELSKKHDIPFFSSSSFRFLPQLQEIINGKYGQVVGADMYSPAPIEPSHPDFFYYGIHAIEMLVAVMGKGCQSITRIHHSDTDILVAVWNDGRIGTVRGIRSGKAEFGGTIHCEKAILKVGQFEVYEPILDAIINLFETSQLPFDAAETLEICAIIEAADLSKLQVGQRIDLSEIQINK